MKDRALKKLFAEATPTNQLRAMVTHRIISDLKMDIENLSYEINVNQDVLNPELEIINNIEEMEQYLYEREDNFKNTIALAITIFTRDELEDIYANINREKAYEKLFDYFDFLKTINNEFVKDIHFIYMLLEFKINKFNTQVLRNSKPDAEI